MNIGVLETMEAPEPREYMRFLLWHYRVMDGFWFLFVEKEYGRKAAEYLDELVWAKIAGMSAKDLVQRFNIQEKGIKGLVKALQFLPWTMLVGYHVSQTGEDEALVTVPECPTQMARVKHGLPEFHCQDMHQAEFESFAHAIDPRIKVECLLAPPDHPPDMFCKWRFTIDESKVV